MVAVDYQQVLTAARQLPKRSQLKLASALLKEAVAPASQLEPLSGLNEAELRALVESELAPRHAKRLKQLLKLNREKKLSRPLKVELDDLLVGSDQIALLKARAHYTLSSHAC
jgi:hypothetical protein